MKVRAVVMSRGKITFSETFESAEDYIAWERETFPEASVLRLDSNGIVYKSGSDPVNIIASCIP